MRDVLGEQRMVDADRARTYACQREVGEHPAIVGVAQDVGLVALADTEGDQALGRPSHVVVELIPTDGVHFPVVENGPIGGAIARTLDRFVEHFVDVSEIPELH